MSPEDKTLFRGLIGGGRAGDAATATGRQMSSNIAVQLAGRVITIGIGLVTVPVMARSLDPDGFGVFAAGLAFVGIFASFTQLGLTAGAMQRMAADPERESEWLGALIATRLVLALLLTVACVASIPLLLSSDKDAQLVALALTPTILLGVAGSQMAIFQSRLRAAVPQALFVVQNLLWLGVVLLLGIAGRGAVYFAVGYVAVTAALALMQVVASRHFIGVAWGSGWSLWRPLLRIGLPLGIAAAMISIYYRVDSVLLLELDSADEAGIYAVAYRFLDPLIALPGIIMSTFFPVLAAVYERDRGRARRLVQQCAEVMFMVTLPCFVAVVALADQIVGLLFGPEYSRSAGVLQILMAALVSIGFGTLAGLLASVLGLQWRLALYSTLGAVANLSLNIVLIPLYGAYGAALTTVVTEVLTMTLMFWTALRVLEMRLAFGRLARITVAASGLLMGLLALRQLGLVPAIIGGALIYPGLLLALRLIRRDDLRRWRAPTA